jgi:hypothetical protein
MLLNGGKRRRPSVRPSELARAGRCAHSRWATRPRPRSTVLSNAGLVIRRLWLAGRFSRLSPDTGSDHPVKAQVRIWPEKAENWQASTGRSAGFRLLVSRRPSITPRAGTLKSTIGAVSNRQVARRSRLIEKAEDTTLTPA